MEFGQWLRNHRLSRALPLRRMAAKVGLSPAYLSSLELGKRVPSDRTIKMLATFFEVHPMELYQRISTRSELVGAARGHPHQEQLAHLIRATRGLDEDGMKSLVEAVRQTSTTNLETID